MSCAIALLVLNFVCVCLSLAGNLAALTGSVWWKEGRIEHGLWRQCTKQYQGDSDCDIKPDIFKFEGEQLKMVIVILLLVVSSGLMFLALVSTLSMFCCLRSRACWTCGATLTGLKTFIGGGAGLAAMIYFEVVLAESKINPKGVVRGWSNIIGWVGSGLGVLAFVFSSTMCCVKPYSYDGGNVVVNPPYAPTKDYPMVNRGYQHGY